MVDPAVTTCPAALRTTTVAAFLMVRDAAAEVDGRNTAAFVGTNFAVSECTPMASVVTVRLAFPETTLTVPSSLVPS